MLVEALGLDGTGRLLDVGCGPAVLTRRLTPFFGEAVGLDPEPDMLAEAARVAPGCRFVEGRAEDLRSVAPGPWRLVTFGQSLHWTHQARVIDEAWEVAGAGSALAVIGHGREQLDGPSRLPGDAPSLPLLELKELADRWAVDPAPTPPIEPRRIEAVLAESRYGGFERLVAPEAACDHDVDTVLAQLQSMSWGAPWRFGQRNGSFLAEARALLLDISPTGRFIERPGDTVVLLARRDP